jgi:hypothetical protein
MPFLNRPFRPTPRAAWCQPLRRVGLALPGMALFSGFLLGLPLTPHTMAQMQALNRELGVLCSKPPRQALNVCRIHARLVDAL